MTRAGAPSLANQLADKDRELVAQAWIEMGLAEHASVASFARFILELLALGAPASLVSAAIEAMKDEVEHARLCFGVAKHWSGKPVGPGRLDISSVLEDDVSHERIVHSTIVEGCVGETIATRVASAAHELTEDDQIRAVLARIAADEGRHAELAWRFVSWALNQFPELILQGPRWIGSLKEQYRVASVTDDTDDDRMLARYGQVRGALWERVVVGVFNDSIAPRLETMFRLQVE